MKSFSKIIILFSLVSVLASCVREDNLSGVEVVPVVADPSQRGIVEVKGSITQNTKWSVNNKYLLKGFVYVEPGATLTIEPGTIIKGDKATKGSLIIKPGAKIIAEGTDSQPIVFTSSQAKGQRNYGDWGGLVLLGKAPVNKAPATIEGENITTFGGTEANDNSGVLKYVRIEFAGIAFETDKEINGLTLGGVGSGTTIDYVQISYSGDDAYEWFGGTANAKHLVSYRTLDDDFDTDWGFAGRVQYAVALRDPAVADQCSCSDSNGFESDNDASASNANPQTSAQFANVSLFIANGTVNAKYRSAFRLRRNTALSVYNSLVVGGYNRTGLELEQDVTIANFLNNKMTLSGLVITGMSRPFSATLTSGSKNTDYPTLMSAKLQETGRNNGFGNKIDDLKLESDFNKLSSPKFIPMIGSPLLSGGVGLPGGFEQTSYRGAFSNTDWTSRWTNFDPQNADY
jgi:hypothetical protein